MAVTGLIDVHADYFHSQVRMTWRFPLNAPETVHIYSVKQSGAELEFDRRVRITKDLRECNSGISFEYNVVSNVDVKRVTFCVFLAERNFNSPNIRALQSMGGCFVSVIIGRGDVFYDIKSKDCGGGFVSHQIYIKGTSTFDAGILGYTYNFNGKDITIELPGKIDSGVKSYPPIYLMRDSGPPSVCLTDGSNADVTVMQRKISTFRRK